MLLSVILPNFNHGIYLEKRIPSLLNQMPKNSELIIVDDASTDHSLVVIEKYIRLDSRLKLIRNFENLGVNKSVNRAFEASKGTYILPQGADDIALDGFIECCLEMLLKHPEIPICFCQTASIIENNIETLKADPFFDPESSPKIFSSSQLIKFCIEW